MASAGGNDQFNGSNNASSNEKGLEGFITMQISEQRSNRTDGPGENIDEEKMNRFMARALGESRRMNQEVEKSQAKLAKLHSELGAERMAAWRQEHARRSPYSSTASSGRDVSAQQLVKSPLAGKPLRNEKKS